MNTNDVSANDILPDSSQLTTTDSTTAQTEPKIVVASENSTENDDQNIKKKTPPKKKGSETKPKDKQQWPALGEAQERSKKGKGTAQQPSSTSSNISPSPTSSSAATAEKAKTRQKKGVNWIPLKDALGPQPKEGGRDGGSRPSSSTAASNPPLSPSVPIPPPNTPTANPEANNLPTNTISPSNRGRGSGRSRPFNRGGPSSYRGSSKSTSPRKQAQLPPLKESIQAQIEYYFSTDNLCRDIYLRKQMDEEGWVSLDLLSNFNCVQKLTHNKQFILESLQSSTLLETKEDKIRLKENWSQWLFPPNISEQGKTEPKTEPARDTPLEESERVEKEEEELVEFDEALIGSYDDEDDEVKDLDDHHISNLIIITRSPDDELLPASNKDLPPDVLSFLNDGLLVYEDNLQNKQSLSPLSSSPSSLSVSPPSSSSSSIPSTSPSKTSSTPKKKSTPKKGAANKTGRKGQRLYPKDKNAEISPHVGWVMNSPKTSSTSTSSSGSTPIAIPQSSNSSSGPSNISSSPEKDPKKVPYFPHPSHALLEEKGFVQHQYDKYHDQSLKERSKKGIGKSQEMNTLFRFWSHFLRTHYNERMYNEMKQFALEDADANYRYGMECLFRYYSYGLEKRFRNNLFTDFQDLTLRDYKNGQLYGLEKFWAYLKYRKDKRQLNINPELAKILENYNRIEDFRPHI